MDQHNPNGHAPVIHEAVEIPKTETPIAVDQQIALKAHTESFQFMNRERWQLIDMMAKSFVQAKALPATLDNAPKVAMVLQAGFEAGLKPIQALNSFYFVNGRIAMFGDVAIQQVIKAGHTVRWGVYIDDEGNEKKMPCNEKQASVTIVRGDNQETMSAHLTLEEAKANGVYKDTAPWRSHTGNMLKYRVFSRVSHFLTPDALNGIGIGDVQNDDEVVAKLPENVTDLGDVQVVDDSKTSGQITPDANTESLAAALDADDNVSIDEPKPKAKRRSPKTKK